MRTRRLLPRVAATLLAAGALTACGAQDPPRTRTTSTSPVATESAAVVVSIPDVATTETQPGGYPTSYLNVVHVVRVGRALLVDTDYGEGGFGPPGSLARHVRSSATEAGPVVAAMCTFTTAPPADAAGRGSRASDCHETP